MTTTVPEFLPSFYRARGGSRLMNLWQTFSRISWNTRWFTISVLFFFVTHARGERNQVILKLFAFQVSINSRQTEMCSTASEQSRPNNRNQEAIAQRDSIPPRSSSVCYSGIPSKWPSTEEKTLLVIDICNWKWRLHCFHQIALKQQEKNPLRPRYLIVSLIPLPYMVVEEWNSNFFKGAGYVLLPCQPFVVRKNIKGKRWKPIFSPLSETLSWNSSSPHRKVYSCCGETEEVHLLL